MFSGIPPETPLDLRFSLFGINVRVHPLHWVVSALLGWYFFADNLLFLPVWLFAVFSSVLLHEMGHVFMGRVFGADGHILLFSFGGLAIGASDLRKRWQRILVSFAGPLIQLVFLGLIVTAGHFLLPHARVEWLPALARVYVMFWIINLIWPLFNLLPLWPLDGGKIARELLEGGFGHQGVIISLWISMIVAGALAVQVLLNAYHPEPELIPKVSHLLGDSMFNAMFFGLFAIGSYQALQIERSRRTRWDDELPWER